jgi:ABC-type Na+ transport system ATPase subunit NatA
MIEARNLVKRYGSTLAVNDLSFSVRPGNGETGPQNGLLLRVAGNVSPSTTKPPPGQLPGKAVLIP